jgi:hypothetical protein
MDKLALARDMVGQARELVATGRVVTVKLGEVLVQAQAVQMDEGVELTFMADTPLGPMGGKLYAPQQTFENMMQAASISNVLPRAREVIDEYGGEVAITEPRFLLTR